MNSYDYSTQVLIEEKTFNQYKCHADCKLLQHLRAHCKIEPFSLKCLKHNKKKQTLHQLCEQDKQLFISLDRNKSYLLT